MFLRANIQKNIYIKKEKTGFSYCLLFFYSSKGLLLVLLFFLFPCLEDEA